MKQEIFLWDKNGTIIGTLDLDDQNSSGHVILPGVEQMMKRSLCNVVISGGKSFAGDSKNFDENIVMKQFSLLMEQLPITMVAFSPWAGGIACFVMIKKSDTILVKKMHEDPRYKEYIGRFKKPDIGMFVVIKDLLQEEFGYNMSAENALMIGDTYCDEEGAKNFDIPFLHAQHVHKNSIK